MSGTHQEVFLVGVSLRMWLCVPNWKGSCGGGGRLGCGACGVNEDSGRKCAGGGIHLIQAGRPK